jgi:FMN phosphatase YigB (HAD superfamily)
MKIVLFDLGDTLEFRNNGLSEPMPGAIDLLSSINTMHDIDGNPPFLGLVSDFDLNRRVYIDILRGLHLDNFFSDLTKQITLSNDEDVGCLKPCEKIFRVAIDKVQEGLPFQNALFITEKKEHIDAVKRLGMRGIRFRFPPDDIQQGDVDSLLGMIPHIQTFVLGQ